MGASPIVTATLQSAALAGLSSLLAQLLSPRPQATITDENGAPISLGPEMASSLDPLSFGFIATVSGADIARFTLIALLTSPPNYIWQVWLEKRFPTRVAVDGPTGGVWSFGRSRRRSSSVTSDREMVVLNQLDPSDVSSPNLPVLKQRAQSPSAATSASLLASGSINNILATSHPPPPSSSAQPSSRNSSFSRRNFLIKTGLDCTVGAAFNVVAFIALSGFFLARSKSEISEAVWVQTLPIMIAGLKIWPAAGIINFALIPPPHRLLFLSFVSLIWGVWLSLVERTL